MDEIRHAVEITIKWLPKPNITTPSHIRAIWEANLAAIATLRNEFGCKVVGQITR